MGANKKKRSLAKTSHGHALKTTKVHQLNESLRQQPQLQQRKSKFVQPKSQQHTNPTVPFWPTDRILLLGEGDFSFSLSLLQTHGCFRLLPTCFDSQSQLVSKYPQAESHIRALRDENITVLYGIDATKLGAYKQIRKGLPREDGYGTDEEGGEWKDGGRREDGGKEWDRIVFNFPHVGGKSTDVNRQVRYNQELLVSFFRSAIPLLSRNGTIVVTLFESEPYTLWNIRDLARHVGLQVVTSFKFHAEAYPGYKHARTLGNIEGGGGWKGEGRGARTYIFEKKAEARNTGNKAGDEHNGWASNKRKRQGEDSESDDDG